MADPENAKYKPNGLTLHNVKERWAFLRAAVLDIAKQRTQSHSWEMIQTHWAARRNYIENYIRLQELPWRLNGTLSDEERKSLGETQTRFEASHTLGDLIWWRSTARAQIKAEEAIEDKGKAWEKAQKKKRGFWGWASGAEEEEKPIFELTPEV